MARKHYTDGFRRQAVDVYESTEGATLSGIAGDLGLARGTLAAWVAALGRGTTTAATGSAPATRSSGASPSADTGGRGESQAARLVRLEARVRELEAETTKLNTEREILRSAAKYFGRRDELVSRFQFVADHRHAFEVKRLCQTVEISRSSFYAWDKAADARAQRAAADAALAERVRAVHKQDRAYGAPRVTAELNDGAASDDRVNHKRVARVMREHNLAGIRLRRRVRTTIPEPSQAKVEDLLKRDFTAPAPNVTYVGDITYLPLACGKNLYLATVIDCYSRRLAGWAIADHMRTDLIAAALSDALATRGSLTGAVVHADHGAQYTSRQYAELCRELGVTPSMGAVGSSADNALAESFNATLKRELLQGAATWPDELSCRRDLFRWATRYNTRRRHSWCNQQAPNTYEAQHVATLANAA
ncbi:MAG: IS3 family transposase [Propionibacteriales bacterium]|nr:IS3 family transposase [Propionibacteriales bacterium]